MRKRRSQQWTSRKRKSQRWKRRNRRYASTLDFLILCILYTVIQCVWIWMRMCFVLFRSHRRKRVLPPFCLMAHLPPQPYLTRRPMKKMGRKQRKIVSAREEMKMKIFKQHPQALGNISDVPCRSSSPLKRRYRISLVHISKVPGKTKFQQPAMRSLSYSNKPTCCGKG